MTHEEAVATLEDQADEHHEVLHRLVTLIDKLQDRVIRLEGILQSIHNPSSDEQPRHTH